MSKEYLEAFDRIEQEINGCINIYHIEENDIDIVKQALLELKAIKETNPSEAMGCLYWIGTHRIEFSEFLAFTKDISEYNTIKNYILKAQEQEKALDIIKNKGIDLELFSRCHNFREYNKGLIDIYKGTKYYKNSRNLKYTEEEFNTLKRWTERKEAQEE